MTHDPTRPYISMRGALYAATPQSKRSDFDERYTHLRGVTMLFLDLNQPVPEFMEPYVDCETARRYWEYDFEKDYGLFPGVILEDPRKKDNASPEHHSPLQPEVENDNARCLSPGEVLSRRGSEQGEDPGVMPSDPRGNISPEYHTSPQQEIRYDNPSRAPMPGKAPRQRRRAKKRRRSKDHNQPDQRKRRRSNDNNQPDRIKSNMSFDSRTPVEAPIHHTQTQQEISNDEWRRFQTPVEALHQRGYKRHEASRGRRMYEHNHHDRIMSHLSFDDRRGSLPMESSEGPPYRPYQPYQHSYGQPYTKGNRNLMPIARHPVDYFSITVPQINARSAFIGRKGKNAQALRKLFNHNLMFNIETTDGISWVQVRLPPRHTFSEHVHQQKEIARRLLVDWSENPGAYLPDVNRFAASWFRQDTVSQKKAMTANDLVGGSSARSMVGYSAADHTTGFESGRRLRWWSRT